MLIKNNKESGMDKKFDLERVFGSKAKISFLRFLSLNKDWQFNLSKISSEIKIDKGNLSRLVNELEKLKVIEVKRNGKLLLFKLNLNNKLVSKLIIPFFEKEGKLK